MAVNIQGRVRLRQSAALGMGQHVGEISPAFRHRTEDVIAGAVHNSIDGALAVSDQRFTQRPDYRDSTADAGLQSDEAAPARRRFEDPIAMLRQQRLVRGYDIFAGLEGLEDEASGGLDPAKQFNHHVNIGAGHQSGGVAGDQVRSQTQSAIRSQAAIGNSRQLQARAEPGGKHGGMAAQQFDDSAADCAAAEQSNANRLHQDARRLIGGLAQRAYRFDAGRRTVVHRMANSAQRLAYPMLILNQSEAHKAVAVGAEADPG